MALPCASIFQPCIRFSRNCTRSALSRTCASLGVTAIADPMGSPGPATRFRIRANDSSCTAPPSAPGHRAHSSVLLPLNTHHLHGGGQHRVRLLPRASRLDTVYVTTRSPVKYQSQPAAYRWAELRASRLEQEHRELQEMLGFEVRALRRGPAFEDLVDAEQISAAQRLPRSRPRSLFDLSERELGGCAEPFGSRDGSPGLREEGPGSRARSFSWRAGWLVSRGAALLLSGAMTRLPGRLAPPGPPPARSRHAARPSRRHPGRTPSPRRKIRHRICGGRTNSTLSDCRAALLSTCK